MRLGDVSELNLRIEESEIFIHFLLPIVVVIAISRPAPTFPFSPLK